VAAGITLAVGNLFDRASIERAMVGIGVFSVQASSPQGEISDEQEIIQGKPLQTAPWRPESTILFILRPARRGKASQVWGISTASRK
jgi:hypothetical protein